jgi:hypothetical protein
MSAQGPGSCAVARERRPLLEGPVTIRTLKHRWEQSVGRQWYGLLGGPLAGLLLSACSSNNTLAGADQGTPGSTVQGVNTVGGAGTQVTGQGTGQGSSPSPVGTAGSKPAVPGATAAPGSSAAGEIPGKPSTKPSTPVDSKPGEVKTGGTDSGNSEALNPGKEEVLKFESQNRGAALRKVKNLMTGFAPTQEEYAVLAAVPATGDTAEAQGLYEAMRSLVVQWIETPEFDKKLIAHFRNVFQQKGFSMQEDMKGQFLEYGPFDLNPTFSYGDTAYTRFEKNFSDSFARTALYLAKTTGNFSEVLTTRTHMMTTALLAAYLQIEQPNDAPLQFALPRANGPTWNLDRTRVIPIEEAVSSMTFDDQKAATGTGFLSADAPECDAHDYSGANGGAALLFQRLIGLTPRWNYVANPKCFEHPSKPYFEPADTEDWRLITLTGGAPTLKPWDIPSLRGLKDGSSMAVNLPRVGFYTTPAYLALWRTNDSNQHRVTANQTLLVALGHGFTSEQALVPVTKVGLDEAHSATDGECYGCHKSLDTFRQFWENQFDYGDRNDFKDNQGTVKAGTGFGGGTASKTRPTTRGGVLAFGDVNAPGAAFDDLGKLLLSASDGKGLPRFAISMAQQLCYWADSSGCGEGDNEFRRVAQAFVDGKYNYKLLVAELLSSPLVTGFSPTATFDSRNVTVSINRRDHLCAALGNRLKLGDVCGLEYAFPQSTGFGGRTDADNVKAVFRIAGTIAADAFSRGSEVPVTPNSPTLFYAAGSELFCEYVAGKAVGTVYNTTDIDGSLHAMVRDVMGYPDGETLKDKSSPAQAAFAVLRANYNEALAVQGSSATLALQSTFSLACQAPTSLGLGI